MWFKTNWWKTKVTFFLGDPFLYFKYWNSGTVDFCINGFNMKPLRLLNATRCSFFDFSSLATLVATFVSWTHFWSHWPRLSRCSTDCQTSEFRRFDQLQVQSFIFWKWRFNEWICIEHDGLSRNWRQRVIFKIYRKCELLLSKQIWHSGSIMVTQKPFE